MKESKYNPFVELVKEEMVQAKTLPEIVSNDII